jgi:hypothetical protein
MNWYGIWALKKLGLARHVYQVKLSQLPSTPEPSRLESSIQIAAPAAVGSD